MKEAQRRVCGIVLALSAAVTLAACAPEVRRKPIDFTPATSDTVAVYTLKNEVTVTPATGYSRTLAAGSQWRLIGRTPQGEVLRPLSGVFTVESAQVHEAGIVVWESKLTGFYLLVERSFVQLDPPAVVQLVQGAK